MIRDINKLVSKMTLKEKASLCSGKDFWELKGVERLEIPSIMVTDGPHGLRKQSGSSDHLGLNASVAATCFPTASATACSWDQGLMREIGEALAKECLQEDVAIILGPGVNIKRSPLCGRNFEYISEDPYLTGEMALAITEGIQSKGIGTSLKHFAANNQEKLRMTIDSVVDERTLREIYLAGFETVVKKSQPWTVMCAYNKLQGTYCSENKKLLTDILKEEWGHEGIVVTDWGACNDRVEGLKAGQELEMPASFGYNDAKIVQAVKQGDLDENILDKAVQRILALIFKGYDNRKPGYKYDRQSHHDLARHAAGQSAVLLKNDGNILPLKRNQKVALIGQFAKKPRYQGSGSSLINPWKLDSACDTFDEKGINYVFCEGYSSQSDKADLSLILEAKNAAEDADIAIIFAGLPATYESEGFDRLHLDMPEAHNKLISEIAKVNTNIVVVLQNGAPVSMPWIDSAQAVLESYLGGQAGNSAVVDILYGDVNPSGKLAETFPVSLKDTPCYRWYPEGSEIVEYRESIYVGYRFYDSAQKKVLFPFGHGLSYTKFEYSDLKLSSDSIKDNQELIVKITVKNVGTVEGSEIVQLYVKDDESTIFRPEHELKGFSKICLEAGEEKIVEFTLDKRSFAYYNIIDCGWQVETGYFTIEMGSSSRDIRLVSKVHVQSSQMTAYIQDLREQLKLYYDINEKDFDVDDKSFETLLGYKIPSNEKIGGNKFSINTTLGEFKATEYGKEIYWSIRKSFVGMLSSGEKDNAMTQMAESMVEEMPLRAAIILGLGELRHEEVEREIEKENNKI